MKHLDGEPIKTTYAFSLSDYILFQLFNLATTTNE